MKVVPVSPELWHAQLPRRERVAYVDELLAEATLDHPRSRLVALDVGMDVDANVPHRARRELDAPADRPAVDLAALGEDHLRARAALRIDEEELVVACVEARLYRLGQGLRRLGIAEREVVVLHREDVREVAAEPERKLERDRLHRVVVDAQGVLHAVADEALAGDRDDVGREAGPRVAEVEGRGEILDLVGREQERRFAVDPQLEDREEADVLGEEPARRPAEVAGVVAHAERRALEDRQRHATTAGFAPHSIARAP